MDIFEIQKCQFANCSSGGVFTIGCGHSICQDGHFMSLHGHFQYCPVCGQKDDPKGTPTFQGLYDYIEKKQTEYDSLYVLLVHHLDLFHLPGDFLALNLDFILEKGLDPGSSSFCHLLTYEWPLIRKNPALIKFLQKPEQHRFVSKKLLPCLLANGIRKMPHRFLTLDYLLYPEKLPVDFLLSRHQELLIKKDLCLWKLVGRDPFLDSFLYLHHPDRFVEEPVLLMISKLDPEKTLASFTNLHLGKLFATKRSKHILKQRPFVFHKVFRSNVLCNTESFVFIRDNWHWFSKICYHLAIAKNFQSISQWTFLAFVIEKLIEEAHRIFHISTEASIALLPLDNTELDHIIRCLLSVTWKPEPRLFDCLKQAVERKVVSAFQLKMSLFV